MGRQLSQVTGAGSVPSVWDSRATGFLGCHGLAGAVARGAAGCWGPSLGAPHPVDREVGLAWLWEGHPETAESCCAVTQPLTCEPCPHLGLCPFCRREN